MSVYTDPPALRTGCQQSRSSLSPIPPRTDSPYASSSDEDELLFAAKFSQLSLPHQPIPRRLSSLAITPFQSEPQKEKLPIQYDDDAYEVGLKEKTKLSLRQFREHRLPVPEFFSQIYRHLNPQSNNDFYRSWLSEALNSSNFVKEYPFLLEKMMKEIAVNAIYITELWGRAQNSRRNKFASVNADTHETLTSIVTKYYRTWVLASLLKQNVLISVHDLKDILVAFNAFIPSHISAKAKVPSIDQPTQSPQRTRQKTTIAPSPLIPVKNNWMKLLQHLVIAVLTPQASPYISSSMLGEKNFQEIVEKYILQLTEPTTHNRQDLRIKILTTLLQGNYLFSEEAEHSLELLLTDIQSHPRIQTSIKNPSAYLQQQLLSENVTEEGHKKNDLRSDSHCKLITLVAATAAVAAIIFATLKGF